METWQGIKLTPLTKQLLDKYCVETGENPGDVLQKAFEQFVEKTTINDMQNQEPAFEVPLTPDQHALMRTWIDAKDFIEIVTGPGQEKATVINSRQLWRKNHPDWKHDEMGELVRLNITVMSPFLDFIKEYLRFFGCKDDVETFCMKAIYAKVQSLNGDLEKFAGTHGLNPYDWFERFNERTHGSSQDEENDC